MIRGSSAARYRPKFALLRLVTGDVGVTPVVGDTRRRRPEPVEGIERLDARLDAVTVAKRNDTHERQIDDAVPMPT